MFYKRLGPCIVILIYNYVVINVNGLAIESPGMMTTSVPPLMVGLWRPNSLEASYK